LVLLTTQQRDCTFFILGFAMIALFILLRTFNVYGDPDPWVAQGDFIRSGDSDSTRTLGAKALPGQGL
jgi:hypothetical protein